MMITEKEIREQLHRPGVEPDRNRQAPLPAGGDDKQDSSAEDDIMALLLGQHGITPPQRDIYENKSQAALLPCLERACLLRTSTAP